MTVHGYVRNEVIVLDAPGKLPEGAQVVVEVVKTDDSTPRPERSILKYSAILRLGPDASRRIDDELYGAPGFRILLGN